MAEKDPIVISGGGPVAMVLAVALYREGIPFIALETLHEPFIGSAGSFLSSADRRDAG